MTSRVFGDPEVHQQVFDFTLDGSTMHMIDRNPDPKTEYILNSGGYRGPELCAVDLVALGCSQTFGMGVLEEDTWPSRLSNITGMSYVNLGKPSESSQGILNHALAYIKKYGKPKVIAVLFPGYGRMTVPINLEINKERIEEPDAVGGGVIIRNLEMDTRSGGIVKFAKRPYPLENILGKEIAMYQSMKAISYLIEYCKVSGINLVFTSWNGDMLDVMKSIGYENYVHVEGMNQSKVEERCHMDQQPLHPLRWEVGSDESHHIGVHAHIHYAEAFAKKLTI